MSHHSLIQLLRMTQDWEQVTEDERKLTVTGMGDLQRLPGTRSTGKDEKREFGQNPSCEESILDTLDLRKSGLRIAFQQAPTQSNYLLLIIKTIKSRDVNNKQRLGVAQCSCRRVACMFRMCKGLRLKTQAPEGTNLSKSHNQ